MDERLDAWDYALPEDRIARFPAEPRDASRLMRVSLRGDAVEHGIFRDIQAFLAPGDLLVANHSRVMHARIRGRRATGGAVELLLLGAGPGPITAMARPARKIKDGEVIALVDAAGRTVGEARVEGRDEVEGTVTVTVTPDAVKVMSAAGEVPLPPYLGRPGDASDATRYQTVYASALGSAAAPTAGLHFTPELLALLRALGVGFAPVTLHVGIGTFRPLREEDVAAGRLHTEATEVPPETADAIEACRARGGRVVAVGTTSLRALEAATDAEGRVRPRIGTTDIFLRPPHRLRSVDGLITNFHLPRSSLMMLVACLTGRERLLALYREAVDAGYRFYSYGDAMLLL
jgi:S-adenosylmethionine:tRNA ribosyltransferase-isomerase